MDRKWCQCGGAREVIRELPVRREKQIMNKKNKYFLGSAKDHINLIRNEKEQKSIDSIFLKMKKLKCIDAQMRISSFCL